MTWEYFEIRKKGKCKLAAVNSTNLLNCIYELGIIMTGKSRQFWGHQIVLKTENEGFTGRDHSSCDSYSQALNDLNSKLVEKELVLKVAGNDNSYSE